MLEALEDRCLLSSGGLDPTFGSGGTVTTAMTNNGSYGHGVLLQPNGDLIAYGIADTATKKNSNPFGIASFGLARYTPNGGLDTTFGNSGEVITSQVGKKTITANDFGTRDLGVAQAALQLDGKIVAVGNDNYLVRYNSNGSLDTTFGSQGLVVVPSGFSVQSLLIQPSNGDIVVAGSSNNSFALLRYTPNGVLDSSFGNNGEVVTPAAGGSITSLTLENGDLVAGGGQSLARYTLSGNLDTTFGSGGIVTIPMGFPSLLVQPDGEIVAVGTTPAPSSYSNIGGNTKWELARYTVNGSLDSTFGNGGTVTSSITGGDVAEGAALESNGQIVVVGGSFYAGFELGVYNPNGSIDTSFGSGGFVSQPGFTGYGGFEDYGSGVVIQPDGKIVTATSANAGKSGGSNYGATFMLARYDPPAAQIGSFTASPNPVTSGSSVTLTASNITLADPSSTITQVAFYLDSNNDGSLETGTDQLLGDATQSSPGVWTLTDSSAFGLTAGTYKLFAQAEDSDGVFGDPVALTLTVQ
jgi:uncharacterized delta-60 repeat protein